MAAQWPTTNDAWLEDYAVWRIQGGTRPNGVPAEVPQYAKDFVVWCVWRRKGRPEPRPDVDTTIPKWAYEVLEGVNRRAPIQIPSTPHSWMLTWAIWRFKNSPPPRPANVPDDPSVVAPYCWSFLNWAAWRRKSPLPPRPTNIPAVIPSWCWDHLKKINQAVPIGPPPPPPPPPAPPKPPSSWALPNPIMFTSWGWFSDSQYRDNDEALVRMRNAGVKTVALQIGQYAPDVPARVRSYGMRVALWGVAAPDDDEAIATARAEGYIPQVETPDEYQRALANIRAGYGASISRSVVTTLYGFNTFTRRPPSDLYPEGELTTVEYEAIRELGVTHAWVECYVQDGGAHFPISKMIWAADQRGFDWANPLIGLWRETQVSAYRPSADPNTLDSFGRQIGCYLSEGMIPQNWVDLGNIGA